MRGHPSVAGRFADAGGYLDSASYGLPPLQALADIRLALEQWGSGTARWAVDWDPAGETGRTLLASILGTSASDVALVPAVSVGTSIVASLLRPGDEVIVAEDEFASLLLPLLAAEADRGARVQRVPFDAVADAISRSTALVAISHVRANDGVRADLDTLVAAARSTDTPVLVDATHSAGILATDIQRRDLDFVVAAGYKHLLCPRGVGVLAVAERWHERLVPTCASWRAQADPYRNFFCGGMEKLAMDAARFDVSLTWFSWVGAKASLRLLADIPALEREAWCVGLAAALAHELGLEPTGSSLVAVPVTTDSTALAEALGRENVRVTCSDDAVRASFHLYNDETDVERAVAAIAPLRDPARCP